MNRAIKYCTKNSVSFEETDVRCAHTVLPQGQWRPCEDQTQDPRLQSNSGLEESITVHGVRGKKKLNATGNSLG